jgi:hypothetical protein
LGQEGKERKEEVKLTNLDLRRIIQEELSYVLSEKSKTKRSDRVGNYLEKLSDTIFVSSDPETLEKLVSFYDDRGHWLMNFTIENAFEQLAGNEVHLGDEMAKPWRFLTLSGQAQLTRKIGESLPMYNSDLFKEKITPKLITMELYLDRSGDFSFTMRSAGISGVEIDELMIIEEQELLNNLAEVLSYYTSTADDLFEMMNSFYMQIGVENLPITSFP